MKRRGPIMPPLGTLLKTSRKLEKLLLMMTCYCLYFKVYQMLNCLKALTNMECKTELKALQVSVLWYLLLNCLLKNIATGGNKTTADLWRNSNDIQNISYCGQHKSEISVK